MSKGLEALQEMRDEAISSICRYVPRQAHEEVTRYFDKRKSIIEKELKALEIISKKGIHCGYLKNTEDLEEYNSHVPWREELNQEEYDTIKEVLL